MLFARTSVYIIAEIGQNHQGDPAIARRMIEEAKKAGANCVKFQKSNLEEKFTKAALDRPYSSENSFGETYGAHKRYLELSVEDMRQLREFAEELGVDFGVSPMDPISMLEMVELRPNFIKIGSGDTNHLPLIQMAIESGLPLIVSTGMQKRSTIEKVHSLLKGSPSSFALLHCISSYPTADRDINLNQMKEMQRRYPDTVVGYSGHELGFNPSLVAVFQGAKVIERHFTLDKSMKGSDHKCSLDPGELMEFVKRVRQWEKLPEMARVTIERSFFPEMDANRYNSFISDIMGSPRDESIYPCEKPCQDKLGKSLVYRNSLPAGTILTLTDLSVKVSEEKGLEPEGIEEVVGRILILDVARDQAVLKTQLQ